MNNFTYENTRRATHLISGEFKKIVKGNYPEYLSPSIGYKWVKYGFSIEYLLECKFITELSRPHNETRDYWTTNSVLILAQPGIDGNFYRNIYLNRELTQGSEMNTKKMIPMGYSISKVKPVIGDEVYNSASGNTFTVDENSIGNIITQGVSRNNHLFVVSFADRVNTGTQPVGDDVEVTCVGNNGTEFTDRAIKIPWLSTPEKSSNGAYYALMKWKPNRDAMLNQWKADQYKPLGIYGRQPGKSKERNDIPKFEPLFDSPMELITMGGVSFYIEAKDRVTYWGIKDSDTVDIKDAEIKPEFTQAMHDAGELPPVGCNCLLILDLACDRDDNTDKTTECKIVAHEGDLVVCIYTEFTGQGFYSAFVNGKGLYKPIQTAEEKLKDAIMDYLNCDAYMAQRMMFAPKFTITLKR